MGSGAFGLVWSTVTSLNLKMEIMRIEAAFETNSHSAYSEREWNWNCVRDSHRGAPSRVGLDGIETV